MKRAALFSAFLLATACGDDSTDANNAAQPDAANAGSADAGNDASQESDANQGPVECEPDEVTFDDGCSSQGLAFNFPIQGEAVSIVTSRSYPSVSGGQPGMVTREDISEQCYIERVSGGSAGTPTNLPCFDAGTLTLSAGGTSVEIPWDSDACYEEGGGQPWAGESVSFDFAGGADIDAVTFDVDLPNEVVIEVVEEAGGATVTRTNADASGDWRLWWIFATEADIFCEPVDGVVTLSAADLAAIDAHGSYSDPVAIETGLDGAYAGDGNGVLVNMGSFVELTSAAW